jgi:hypothetical protein
MRLLLAICWMFSLGFGMILLINVVLTGEPARSGNTERILLACASFLLALCFILLSCFV